MSLKPLLLDISEDESNQEIKEMELENSDIVPIETNSDFGDLKAADEKGIIISDEINDETDADVALEAISNYLNKSLNDSIYDKHTLNMANVAIESIYNRVGINSDKLTFATEDYDDNSKEKIRLALEDIKEKAASLWMSVKEKITMLAKFLGEKMNYFKRNLSNMKADIVRLEKILASKDSKLEAKAKFLKPQSWFIDLMYSGKGMPNGLDGIGKAVDELLRDHRKLATSSVNKYTKWLLDNHKQARVDSKAFSTLKVNKDEFLLNGAKEFNRSIGFKRPTGDNMFYRGKELPGNKAFYTQVRTQDKTGISSIGMIADVGFGIYDFDPVSVKLDRLKISHLANLSNIVWIAAMGGIFATGGAGAAFYGLTAASVGTSLFSIHNTLSSIVKDTGKKITIDKDMLFKTLTLQEAKKVISDLKSGVKSLESWYSEIFENNWKQPELDRVINDITGIDRVDVHNNSSFRALKRYCVALLNLMNATTIGTHIYAFKTYNAMINYCDKSLRQY